MVNFPSPTPAQQEALVVALQRVSRVAQEAADNAELHRLWERGVLHSYKLRRHTSFLDHSLGNPSEGQADG